MGIDIGSIINLNPLPKSGGFLFGRVFISCENHHNRKSVQQNPKGGRRTEGSSYSLYEVF
jgi:hypothetical protein